MVHLLAINGQRLRIEDSFVSLSIVSTAVHLTGSQQLSDPFREQLIGIHNEAVKPVSVYVFSPAHSGEKYFAVTSHKTGSGGQVNHQI